jgi:phosphoribosylpyrophosphate synthetase
MNWDEGYVRQQVRNEWEERKLWVLPYYTKRSGNADGVSEFIWDFKNGGNAAVTLAIDLLAGAVAKIRATSAIYIGAVPSSRQGFPSATVERVCEELAGQFPWLTHCRGMLQRTQAITPAHRCSPGERPTENTHLETIACGGNYNLNGRKVLLFDDVLTRGATFDACSQILKSSANCPEVYGLFLGKTQ